MKDLIRRRVVKCNKELLHRRQQLLGYTSSRQFYFCAVIRANDVVFKVFNFGFLLGNNIVYDITNGNNTNQFFIFHDWKVTCSFFGHQLKAFS